MAGSLSYLSIDSSSSPTKDKLLEKLRVLTKHELLLSDDVDLEKTFSSNFSTEQAGQISSLRSEIIKNYLGKNVIYSNLAEAVKKYLFFINYLKNKGTFFFEEKLKWFLNGKKIKIKSNQLEIEFCCHFYNLAILKTREACVEKCLDTISIKKAYKLLIEGASIYNSIESSLKELQIEGIELTKHLISLDIFKCLLLEGYIRKLAPTSLAKLASAIEYVYKVISFHSEAKIFFELANYFEGLSDWEKGNYGLAVSRFYLIENKLVAKFCEEKTKQCFAENEKIFFEPRVSKIEPVKPFLDLGLKKLNFDEYLTPSEITESTKPTVSLPPKEKSRDLKKLDLSTLDDKLTSLLKISFEIDTKLPKLKKEMEREEYELFLKTFTDARQVNYLLQKDFEAFMTFAEESEEKDISVLNEKVKEFDKKIEEGLVFFKELSTCFD